jgi:hypothetical protein
MDIRLLGHKAFWTYYAVTRLKTECIKSLLSYYVKLLVVIFSIKTVFWSDISFSLREFLTGMNICRGSYSFVHTSTSTMSLTSVQKSESDKKVSVSQANFAINHGGFKYQICSRKRNIQYILLVTNLLAVR